MVLTIKVLLQVMTYCLTIPLASLSVRRVHWNVILLEAKFAIMKPIGAILGSVYITILFKNTHE